MQCRKACHGTCSICSKVYEAMLVCVDDEVGQCVADGANGMLGRGGCAGRGEERNDVAGSAAVFVGWVVVVWLHGGT